MSLFYSGDVVDFVQDDKIVGTIDTTWSEVDIEPSCIDFNVYIHTTTPSNVRKAWRSKGLVITGYVIVELLLPHDGFCLVAENFLRLRDRVLKVDDIVKRKPSDVQSGRVLSSSTECTLSPACSIDEYASARPIFAQGHQPSHGLLSTLRRSTRAEMHGFPDNDQAKTLLSVDGSNNIIVPAGELRVFQDYRRDDYVIYKNWVGRVESVSDEVTVRLTNGSVVVVKESEELEVPLYIPGTSSYELVQRLDRAGYFYASEEPGLFRKAKSDSPDYFYPGQHVRTKKLNLRRGHWKYGAYDPSVEPQGIVVAVRTVELAIEWLLPSFLYSDQDQGPAPPYILNTDDIQRGEIKTFNNYPTPLLPLAKTLATANDAIEIQLGVEVGFRDPVGAAVKYGSSFKTISTAETQGYDMNVLHITSTNTAALIQWQDGTRSEELSISVIPTRNMEMNDVCPGDKVSFKADETTISMPKPATLGLGEPGIIKPSNTVLHVRTIGVVQTVNAVERLAQVRWFRDTDFKLDIAEDGQWHRALPSSTYGHITDEISEVSLYDISVYDAFYPKFGDLAVAYPAVSAPHPQLTDYLGNVVELCLDGEVIIRCYAASQPHDIKIAISNLIMVATLDSDGGGDETDYSVDGDESDESSAAAKGEDDWSDEGVAEPIDIRIEYEGGKKMDFDEDEDAWSTDDDIPSISSPSAAPSFVGDELVEVTLPESKNRTMKARHTLEDAHFHSGEVPGGPSMKASVPLPFLILENDVPRDHQYLSKLHMAVADIGKKAIKEHHIMRSSLPDGVFVRTWESRLDLLRVLIVGPVGTPFEHAPFFFDMQFAAPFPIVPPKVFFHSWTNGLGRVNPNLYEDGKVCLSLLGTWPANERNEGWSKKSTVLQILVSIMGLILVREPYYNEAGFEVLVGSEESLVQSRMYSEKAFVMAKGFVGKALSNPPGGFADVVKWLYHANSGPQLLNRVISDCQKISQWPCATSPADSPERSIRLNENDRLTVEDSWVSSMGKLSTGALILLHRHIELLVEYAKVGTHEANAAVASTGQEG